MEAILGPRLQSKVGPISTTSLNSERFVLLLASAKWCPPCQQFLPILKDFYHSVNNRNQQVQIVYLSRDRNITEFNENYNEMPWLAIPYEQDNIQRLLKFFEIDGIPRLYLLHPNGHVAHTNCREDVTHNGARCLQSWEKLLER